MTNIRDYTLKQLDIYWKGKECVIQTLPIAIINLARIEKTPPRMTLIEMPEWCEIRCLKNNILVPEYFAGDGKWQNVDWIHVCFWYMNGLAEREFERQNGQIHSYSCKLKNWDSRMWEYAWVNRIAIFLREWCANMKRVSVEELFGTLPEANIVLTHDVDAVSKTLAIRLKQTAFHLYNCFRSVQNFKLARGRRDFAKALRFFFSRDDYWQFEKIIELENKFGVKSHFNFFAGDISPFRSLKKKLLDPSYDILKPRIKNIINKLHDGGWTVGLHQSFNSWHDGNDIKEEKIKLESVLGKKIKSSRQHWLRFSWDKTWNAQEEAGLELDTTLGFNDRPGFRNGSALCFTPWDFNNNSPMKLEAIPNVLMDSQFYDYCDYTNEERCREIKRWIGEVNLVRGETTLIWHQRVLSNDYKWDVLYTKINEYLR